jgi:hypothetical protein
MRKEAAAGAGAENIVERMHCYNLKFGQKTKLFSRIKKNILFNMIFCNFKIIPSRYFGLS